MTRKPGYSTLADCAECGGRARHASECSKASTAKHRGIDMQDDMKPGKLFDLTPFLDLSQRFRVLNGEGKPIESHATLDKAEQGARWCNEHEARCGRPSNYTVKDTKDMLIGAMCDAYRSSEHSCSNSYSLEGIMRDVLKVTVIPALLAICEEIAADPRVDLVDSERRIRLYAAITKAGGKL